MNARFWAYVNGGPVKLTLRPGQRISCSHGAPTDEGWHRDSYSWEYPSDERAVYRNWCQDGADCDGRLTRSGVDRCDLSALQAGDYPYVAPTEPQDVHDAWADVVWPAWDVYRDCGVYDEYAQRAGY
jgi:hypothetical protein